MVDLFVEFVKSLLIIFPAYAANGFPPLAKGEKPMDLKRKWFDNRRIFGDGKTFEGFGFGLFSGFVIGALEAYLYPDLNAYAMFFGVQLPLINLFIGFMIALGALCGDLAGSFLKRRFKLKRGADVPLLDQWNFIIGAVLFTFWFTEITIWMFLIMLLITPIFHRIANIIAHKIRVKKEPW
ncbi:MAG: CDP-2,3-bis-(O-geranylgeranyl)-sn-glycerol synthase [Candidatus Aenigmarchaeota archaeon]|nr:CDP-2,3-bis-(O-geranylgeranyl)-sn-glycerol synthase [Candidatus Aenigmarchaeota archaeon]